jgi:hypothetical protein
LSHPGREFAAAWRAWLAKIGREETFRPQFGRPANPDPDEAPKRGAQRGPL